MNITATELLFAVFVFCGEVFKGMRRVLVAASMLAALIIPTAGRGPRRNAMIKAVNGAQAQTSTPSARQVYPTKSWTKVASPEAAGWSRERLGEAREFSRKIGSAAVLIVADGVVVDEWGETSKPFNVRSIRKGLLNALYGLAVQEGKIRLSDTLAELRVDDKEGLTGAEKKARVADLLTSRSGVYHPAAYETRAAGETRPVRGSHPPGTFFYYNNWDFNALGTIFERQTKTTIFEAFQRRLAEPLRMEDFSLRDTKYHAEEASQHAAYLFRMSARDLARFGLLYLRDGWWDGKQLLSREWIAESTRSHVEQATGDADFGYMWWVYPARGGKPKAFAARGSGAQYLFVSPAAKVVVVHLTDTEGTEKRVQDGEGWQLLRMIYAAAPQSSK